MRALCEEAVAAALAGGASYADARAIVRRSQAISTKNQRVDRVDDVESEGIGVRVRRSSGERRGDGFFAERPHATGKPTYDRPKFLATIRLARWCRKC